MVSKRFILWKGRKDIVKVIQMTLFVYWLKCKGYSLSNYYVIGSCTMTSCKEPARFELNVAFFFFFSLCVRVFLGLVILPMCLWMRLVRPLNLKLWSLWVCCLRQVGRWDLTMFVCWPFGTILSYTVHLFISLYPLTFTHLYSIDCACWWSKATGASGEVETCCCVWTKGFSSREADGKSALQLQRQRLQPPAGQERSQMITVCLCDIKQYSELNAVSYHTK